MENNNELDELYFKDVFSVDGDDINMEANHLTINCISSNEDAFNLDSEGNLTVKTITAQVGITAPNTQAAEIANIIYPVGSIYISVNAANPSTMFGGTWAPFATGKTIFGIDTTNSLFNSGEKSAIPTHSHASAAHAHGYGTLHAAIHMAGTNGIRYRTFASTFSANERKADTGTGYATATTPAEGVAVYGSTANITPGATGATSAIPPYITCYIWKRTA